MVLNKLYREIESAHPMLPGPSWPRHTSVGWGTSLIHSNGAAIQFRVLCSSDAAGPFLAVHASFGRGISASLLCSSDAARPFLAVHASFGRGISAFHSTSKEAAMRTSLNSGRGSRRAVRDG